MTEGASWPITAGRYSSLARRENPEAVHQALPRWKILHPDWPIIDITQVEAGQRGQYVVRGAVLAARSVVTYFGIVVVLTLPLWVLGAFVRYDLLPGLPISAVAVVCPTLAAAFLTLREGGWSRLVELLGRSVSMRGAGRWLFPAMLINPVIFSLSFLASRMLGESIPNPELSAVSVLALFSVFLVSALFEEIGWSGYALGRLQARMRPLLASLVLGAFWALWHVPALLQVGRSAEWIVWWCLWSISARVIMVWLYNWSRASVMAVVLYHAASNLCWQMYPVSGSYFDPRVTGLITFAVVMLVVSHSIITRRTEKW